MAAKALFLAVDGGGTGCRARLCDAEGNRLAQAEAGQANNRYERKEPIASVFDATMRCLEQAQPAPRRIQAPLGDPLDGAFLLARAAAQSVAA